MDDDFDSRLDQAIAAATDNERDLLALPGVVAVGAGPERRGGKLTGEAAVIVTVRRKLAPEELEASGRPAIPDRLGDVPVDVLELGAAVEAPEIVAAQRQAAAALERIRDEWLSSPGATGIGVGYKRTGGQRDFNRIALQFFVERKLTESEVRQRRLPLVPGEVDGVVTDVEEQPPLRPASSASGSRDDRKDPLVGGLTVGVNTKPFWYGTLGAIVFDRSTGERLVLGNQHVLDAPPGTDVVQPSPIGLDDSLDIGFQLDVCNPLHFFRLDTPNTTVGSVLAGAAVAAAVAAALSDDIDPTRRGQDATPPPPGARTLAEHHEVRLDYSELPIPGTHFDVRADWRYTRHTDAGDLSATEGEVKTNPHVLVDKLLLTDRTLYHPGDTIRLIGLILPEACAPRDPDDRDIRQEEIEALEEDAKRQLPPLSVAATTRTHMPESARAAIITRRCHCERYHLCAILTPTTVDRAFPVVLREPVAKARGEALGRLLAILQQADDEELRERVVRLVRYGCLYTGELPAADVPTGPWRHYLFVQTVNTAPTGMEPTDAAQIIGGLPVSQNTVPQLDVSCGPLVVEDGQFDIELL